MTDSELFRARGKAGKRERLMAASARVLYERGVERTTIADIAREAGVPVGNVYYYFKTKDELIEAALAEHAAGLAETTAALDELSDPRERLKTLVGEWIGQRDLAARYGCPFGTLATELDKREGGLDQEAARVLRLLLDWTESQFRAMGQHDPAGLAISLIAAYQGMSVLTNVLRDPTIMSREGERLNAWLDSLG
ncbi:TetR/AcrR family transcriptional regulator [Actinocorallia longicatena]|uniref:TetR/AcrR family transcriptional regulator n=1 Tax=Actinocorallia longicatena TaxID=111803 RepID=A0ABP6Q410_9ACTN